jgi:hypothetical protein
MRNRIHQIGDWIHATTTRLMSRCRVCGSSENVIIFDPRCLWAYFFRQTWCPPHCPDHDYRYSRYDGHYCDNCGQEPPFDWFDRFN